nr:response regulator transcription factor [Pseudofrankia sp. DC12]
MRLLIVEDDDRVAAALSGVLGRHGFDIVRARTAARALDLMHTRPDLVLLDLGLPDRDGFEVCGRIRKVSNTPVIMVTARADLSARIHGLYLGADDYIVKPYDLRELIARIHAVVRRSRPDPLAAADGEAGSAGGGRADGLAGDGVGDLPNAATAVGRVVETRGLRIHLDSREVTAGDGRVLALTRKEFDLLAELARAPGVVFRREQLISEVWGSSVQSASRTLEVHVASLRAKLGDPFVVQTVRGVGYRLSAAGAPPPPPVRTGDDAARQSGDTAGYGLPGAPVERLVRDAGAAAGVVDGGAGADHGVDDGGVDASVTGLATAAKRPRRA